MKALTQEQVKINLVDKIDNDTLRRIKSIHPDIDKCPTCEGRGKYVFESKTRKCNCDYQKLLQKHYYAANIGRAYHTLCIDHFISDESELLKSSVNKYTEDWKNNRHFGHGITFNGNVGTGKTFAMSLILKQLVQRGYRVHFMTFDDIINTFGAAWNNDEAKHLNMKLRSVDILGIDELKTDARNSSGFLSTVAESIIRHRAVNLLPTLITTNLTPTEEAATFTKAFSLLSALNVRVETEGYDIRGKEVREREHDMKRKNERRPVC